MNLTNNLYRVSAFTRPHFGVDNSKGKEKEAEKDSDSVSILTAPSITPSNFSKKMHSFFEFFETKPSTPDGNTIIEKVKKITAGYKLTLRHVFHPAAHTEFGNREKNKAWQEDLENLKKEKGWSSFQEAIKRVFQNDNGRKINRIFDIFLNKKSSGTKGNDTEPCPIIRVDINKGNAVTLDKGVKELFDKVSSLDLKDKRRRESVIKELLQHGREKSYQGQYADSQEIMDEARNILPPEAAGLWKSYHTLSSRNFGEDSMQRLRHVELAYETDKEMNPGKPINRLIIMLAKYINTGEFLTEKKDFEQARFVFDKAIALCKSAEAKQADYALKEVYRKVHKSRLDTYVEELKSYGEDYDKARQCLDKGIKESRDSLEKYPQMKKRLDFERIDIDTTEAMQWQRGRQFSKAINLLKAIKERREISDRQKSMIERQIKQCQEQNTGPIEEHVRNYLKTGLLEPARRLLEEVKNTIDGKDYKSQARWHMDFAMTYPEASDEMLQNKEQALAWAKKMPPGMDKKEQLELVCGRLVYTYTSKADDLSIYGEFEKAHRVLDKIFNGQDILSSIKPGQRNTVYVSRGNAYMREIEKCLNQKNFNEAGVLMDKVNELFKKTRDWNPKLLKDRKQSLEWRLKNESHS